MEVDGTFFLYKLRVFFRFYVSSMWNEPSACYVVISGPGGNAQCVHWDPPRLASLSPGSFAPSTVVTRMFDRRKRLRLSDRHKGSLAGLEVSEKEREGDRVHPSTGDRSRILRSTMSGVWAFRRLDHFDRPSRAFGPKDGGGPVGWRHNDTRSGLIPQNHSNIPQTLNVCHIYVYI